MAGTIDFNHLAKYVGDDMDLQRDILLTYADQLLRLLGRLQPEGTDAESGAHLLNWDDTDWQDAMHTLKGASRGVGAWDLGDLGEAGEELVGERQRERLDHTGAILATGRETLAALQVSLDETAAA